MRALSLALCATLPLAACGGGSERPTVATGVLEPTPGARVVLISIDTLRADRLGCYGYERDTSPTIDAFAESAVRFERTYTTSNNTGPSHMTMLSGLLPPVHQVVHEGETALAEGAPHVASLFKRAGYRTGAFADGIHILERYDFDRDFDAWHSRFEWFDTKLDRVEEWLPEVGDDPAFLFVHTYAVHAPYLPPAEHDVFTDPGYDGPIRRAMIELRRMIEADEHADSEGIRKRVRLGEVFWTGRDGSYSDADLRYWSDLYDGCIRGADAGIGRLLAMLDEHGWLDDAWIVITADHGEAFAEHGAFEHRKLYQEELHVPLLVRPPGGLAEGVVVPEAHSLFDLAPTLLDVAGLTRPPLMLGESVFPLESFSERPTWATFGEAPDAHALVAGDFKLITAQGAPYEMYDLGADPGERTDIQDTIAADVLERLLERSRGFEESSAELRTIIGDPEAAAAYSEDQRREAQAMGYGG